MKRKIKVRGGEVIYTLRESKRARRVRLTVRGDGSVMVSVPFGVSAQSAERFVRKKADWIFTKQAQFRELRPAAVPGVGRSREEYLKHKKEAYDLVCDRVAHFNKIYGYHFNRISIRNQKTRWGSCSSKGNLSFNYRLLFLPEKIRDYIVVHELCHLREMNHSKKFWQLVERICPEHKKIRAELRKHSL